MTNRQRNKRIQQVREEFLTTRRKRFPLVEPVKTWIRESGAIVIEVYSPYEDNLEVLETISDRIIDIQLDEDLCFMALPLRSQPEREAA